MADLTTEWVAREAAVRLASQTAQPTRPLDSTSLMRVEIDAVQVADNGEDLNTALLKAWP